MTKELFDKSRYSAQMHVVIEGVSHSLWAIDFEAYMFAIESHKEPDFSLPEVDDGIEWYPCEACEIPELLEVKP